MGDGMKWRSVFVSGLCLAALVACNNQQPETKAVDQAAAPVAEQPATGTEGAVEKPAEAVSFTPIKGKAKEVLHGGGFTYVLVATDKGETWVAMPETKVAVGEQCSVTEGQIMQNFPSKSLNRTFAEIVFAPGLSGKEPAAGAGPHGGGAAMAPPAAKGGGFDSAVQKEAGAPSTMMTDPSPGSGKAVVPFADLKIAKAAGATGYTVADIYGKAASLNGKKVKIKGQVMKFSPQIMGKNWLHLQDGTGDPQKNTHDLVVTSANKAEKGDTVTVEGVVAVNKDFGAGYKYAVIVEDVTITR
jgi:hypothetical protein